MQSFEEFGNYILKHSRHNEVKSDRVRIILNYPKIEWDEYAEYMARLTWFSSLDQGGSKKNCLIFAETLDQAMDLVDDQTNYALISYIGTFYYPHHGNDPTIHKYFDEFCNSGEACRGHILWHPNKQYGRLHLQSMFLNVSHWREIGRPKFGKYTGQVVVPQVCDINIHDNYTPLWIRPDEQYREVKNAEMAEYISKVLEDGKTIKNYGAERRTKFFCYPERRYSEALEHQQNMNSNIVYVRNNERVPKLDDTFDVIYCPAAGSMSEILFKLYGHTDTELIIYDNNPKALMWKRSLYQMIDTTDDLKRLERTIRKDNEVFVDAGSYKPELIEETKSIFDDQDWIDTIKQVKNYKIIQWDALEQVFDVDPSKKNLIHLSNIFAYNFIIHTHNIDSLNDRFIEYCCLPNTTVCGKSPFKDGVLVSTIS